MTYQKINRTLFGALLVAGVMGMAPQAHAAGYCSGGLATEGISAGNVTFNNISANDCYGVVAGNISGTGNGGNDGPAELNALNWGGGWTYFADSDGGTGAYEGLAFSVTAPENTTGIWTLTATDTNGGGVPLDLPASLDFAVALKGGTEYALWGFDNVTVNGANSGVFSIVFTNNGGNTPDLSNLIVFGREAGGGTIAAIPEPETYAMLLAGLGLVGFAARRKLS